MSEFGNSTDIAVVGMACRFPGASTPDQFWRNVRDGVESVRFFSQEQLRQAGVPEELIGDPDYVRAGLVLDEMEQFDAGFFGFSPRDASIMDPQHRHFLECAWEALESSGHMPESFRGAIGVFAGCGMNAYMMYNLTTNAALMDSVGLFLVRHTGNDKDFLSTRVSYQFNLRGPSVSVQTACSTSLVAIHLACQSLLSGECDMALAGGVTIELPHRQGYMYREGEILSKDGHCRSFDADSTGTVFGSGAGIIVLRRLADAVADGDRILAVVKGSAINNDGASKVGYLAPSVEGQARAIREALEISGVPADSVTCIEAHGTATAVGDPIEVEALTEAFRSFTDRRGYCAVGSVKSNIGHLDTAAGVASFIKAVQELRHRQLAPSLHFCKPNPLIDFDSSPFYVNTQLRDWQPEGYPRRAGISSLGVGGTNAHIILEQAPELPRPAGNSQPWQLVPLSARSPKSLDGLRERYASELAGRTGTDFADAAYTAQVGRRAFQHRLIAVARDGNDLSAVLTGGDNRRMATQAAPSESPSIVFAFPGGGAQYPNMGRELYESEPVFRRHADECLAEIAKHVPATDLKSLMYPAPEGMEQAAAELSRPLNSILSIFVIEYALAKLWMAWGIVPTAMTGHSLGEYSAACIGGVLSLADAVALVVCRGRIFDRMPEGAMLNVALSEGRLTQYLGDGLSIAAINGSQSCVASGEVARIAELEQRLMAEEIECSRLHISVAAHSPMLEPLLGEFTALAARIPLRTPSIPYVSNVTGTWVTAADLDATYWVRHLRRTVRFADGLDTLFGSRGSAAFLEVGPGMTLSSLIRQHPGRSGGHTCLASLPHPKDLTSACQSMLMSLGRLWLAGVAVDWEKLWEGRTKRRASLPTYAFDHQRYWIEAGKPVYAAAAPSSSAEAGGTLRKLDDLNSWFYRPVWKKTALPQPAPSASRENWLIFCDGHGLGRAMARTLRSRGDNVVCVSQGDRFYASSELEYTLAGPGDVQPLMTSLLENGRAPRNVVYLWSYGPAEDRSSLEARLGTELARNFHLPLHLLQTLAQEDQLDQLRFAAVVSGWKRVLDTDAVSAPERSLLSGPVRVVSREFQGVESLLIDADLPTSNEDRATLAGHIADQMLSGSQEDRVTAYRKGERYVEEWEQASPGAGRGVFPADGVCVITGGLGGMALSFAEYLGREHKATAVLVHRSPFPEREDWEWIVRDYRRTSIAAAILKIRGIEQAGGTVVLMQGDVTDPVSMRRVFERFGRGGVHAVIHTAGVIDDGPMHDKPAQRTARVLAPKVSGTLAIDALAREYGVGSAVLCSSTSALLALPGQVDYVSANAFLDAWAQSCADGYAVTAVNWGVWNDVGMAARAVRSAPAEDEALARRLGSGSRQGGTTLSARTYAPSVNWELGEHKLSSGLWVFPGTGFVDLAIASIWADGPRDPIELRDVFFVSPLAFAEDNAREVRVHASGGVLTISSSRANEASVDHANAEWTRLPGIDGARRDLAAIRARCARRRLDAPSPGELSGQTKHLHFGPRWSNIREVRFGDGELVAHIRLDDAYADDVRDHPVHPAMLDMATGAGLALTRDPFAASGVYVPLTYGRVVAYRPLERQIFSHVRLVSEAERGICVFDVSVLNEAGEVLLDIERFTMLLVDAGSFHTGSVSVASPAPAARAAAPAASDQLRALVEAGISPTEGAAVLARVLGSGVPQIAATSVDLGVLMERARPRRAPAGAARKEAAAGTDAVENDLLNLWSDLLGVTDIGLDDDFFDLGGQSLVAVRLFTKIRKTYKVDLGLSTLFEARTVRQLAAALRRHLGDSGQTRAFSCLVPLRAEGSKPILFCVHGIGGNVLGYRELVKHLPPDQPFYAIQSVSLDKQRQGPPPTDMKEIAAHYVKEVLNVQPQGPFYLSGYSFGGVAAWEMAQQLTAMGHRVALLAMFDSDRPDAELDLASRIRLNVQHYLRLSGEERLRYARRKLNALGKRLNRRAPAAPATTAPAPERGQQPFSEVRQANFRAYHSYKTLTFDGRLTLFQATEYGDSGFRKPNLGWGGMAAAGLDVRPVPGNHMTILYEPNVSILARKLAECLEERYAEEELQRRREQGAALSASAVSTR